MKTFEKELKEYRDKISNSLVDMSKKFKSTFKNNSVKISYNRYKSNLMLDFYDRSDIVKFNEVVNFVESYLMNNFLGQVISFELNFDNEIGYYQFKFYIEF